MYTPSQGNLVNEKIKIQNSKNKSNPNFSVKQELYTQFFSILRRKMAFSFLF